LTKNDIFHERWLKVISVFLAVMMWFSVVEQDVVQRQFKVPLYFKNLSNELEMTGDFPEIISVRVRGQISLIQDLDITAVRAYVELDGLSAGRYDRPITVELRRGLGVTYINPSTILMTLR
jgi:YbbR domain-containing protein